MAFLALTTEQVNADSPLDTTLMLQVKDNFDALDGADVTNGDSHNHSGGDGAAIPRDGIALVFSTGGIIHNRNDAEVTTTSTASTVLKRTQIPGGGTLRIEFDLKSAIGGSAAQAQIYRNTTAVGTLQQTTSTSYVTFSEDISGWTAGDNCELNAFHLASTAITRFFVIKSAETVLDFINLKE